VPLPELTLGLVVRYEYLWYRRSGMSGVADKDHPACVVATFRRQDRPGDFVIYLPISHTPPSADEEGIELPASVKANAGLDSAPQWVLVSDPSVRSPWRGLDVVAVPGLGSNGVRSPLHRVVQTSAHDLQQRTRQKR